MTQNVQEQLGTSVREKTLNNLNALERASWAIETELLVHGVSTLRLPRSTVVGTVDGEPRSSLGFIGFEGPGTTLTAASFTEHARTVHEMLLTNNLPVQHGQICFTRQIQRATRYANSVGYPVLVRPANGGMTHRVRTIVHSDDEMQAALQLVTAKSHGRTVDRETTLTTAWIQHVPEGQLIRFLVVGSSVVAAVTGELGADEGTKLLSTDKIHPDIRAVAVDALRAVPSLDHGEVQLVVENPSRSTSDQQVAIMTVLESPDMDMYEMDGDFGRTVTTELVQHYLAKSGVDYTEPVQQCSARIVFTGVVETDRFTRQLTGRARKLVGPEADFETIDLADDSLALEFRGDVEIVALLSTLGVRGLVRGLRASTAATELLS